MVEIPDRAKFKAFARREQASGYAVLGPAWQSYNLKRSTNSATILLLGLTGAGKSHTINNIFNKTITPVGDNVSYTKDILEFSIQMPSEDLRISNSQMHVIDTPGFGDTVNGIKFDAKVLANIKKLFEKKNYFPNFILLVLNINDKRIDGEFAPFVKLLKAIKLQLTGTVLDKQHPNLIIVLTHLCGAIPKTQMDPSGKILLVKKIIQQNLGIVDVPVEVAENLAEDYDLEKEGDYFILPTKELFPRNIYHSMVRVAKSIDPIGHGIINEAFHKLQKQDFQISKIEYPFMDYDETTEIVAEIMRMQISETTELGDRLLQTWPQLEPEHQNKCRMKPMELCLKLEIMGMKKRSDLPQSKKKKEVMDFFRELMPDSGMEVLLRKSLGIEAPRFPIDLLIGRGYDIMKDQSTSFKLFELGDLSMATIGCYLPEYIIASDCPEVEFIFNVFQTHQEMVQKRLRQLKIQMGANFVIWPTDYLAFDYKYRSGFNVFSQGSSNKLNAVYEQRMIKLECHHNAPIHPSIMSAAHDLPVIYNKNDDTNVQTWKKFFRTYGTHYISTAYIGGSIIFEIDSTDTAHGNSSFNFHSGGLEVFLKAIFGTAQYGNSSLNHSLSSNQKVNLQVRVNGGNAEHASALATSQNPDEFLTRLPEWVNSIWENPIVTDSSILLREVADVVAKINPKVVNALMNAQDDLYQARLEYESPKAAAPPTRTTDSENNKSNKSEEGSCVIGNTLILTPKNQIPISLLKPGDEVLNRNGKAAKVIGVNKVYTIGITRIYGFHGEPFFTGGHTFLTPDVEILVACKTDLEQWHPQMKTEFSVKEMGPGDFQVMAFENGQSVTKNVDLTYASIDEGQELYFLAVEGWDIHCQWFCLLP